MARVGMAPAPSCGGSQQAILNARRASSSATGAWHEGKVAGTAVQQGRDQSLRAVMTREQVAEFLQVRPRQVERLGVPCLDLGHKTKRYVREDVLAWLEAHPRLHGRAA
jgi:hypothetical protein